jgi:hypothetical protein
VEIGHFGTTKLMFKLTNCLYCALKLLHFLWGIFVGTRYYFSARKIFVRFAEIVDLTKL